MGRFWIFYLVLSVILKLFLIYINFSFDLIPSLPYFFLGSIFMSGLIFLSLDLPVLRAPGFLKKYVKVFATAVYVLIVILVMINIKIYMTLDTFITYPLLVQIADMDVFTKSLAGETDLMSIVLLVAGIVYACATAFSARLLKFSPKFPLVFVVTAAVLITSSTLYSRGHKKELRSIDRDPILELAASALNINGKDAAAVSNTDGKGNTAADKSTSGNTGNNSGNALLPGHDNNPDRVTHPVSGKVKPFTGVHAGAAAGMNVVLFILESTTPCYLSREVTPNILRLSGNALVFNSHYTTEPATMKAVYSLLTGRLPYVTRNWKSFIKESENDVSFSSVLSSKGYYTEFVMPADGKVYYEKEFLLPRFSRVSDYGDLKALYPSSRATSMGLEDNTLIWYMDSFLKKHSGRKFLLTLSSVNPHHPYDVCDRSYEVFGTKTPFDMYKNALRGADDVIGKCYALLSRYGIEKKTIFVLVSDHGEAFYQHTRNYLHSIFLYEENVHTIAMIVNPVLFPRKAELNFVTSHTDIAPTILDLAGTGMGGLAPEGSSIFSDIWKKAIFFTSFSTPYWGCRDGQFKYILNRRYDTEELYDLATDPDEKVNLVTKEAQTGTADSIRNSFKAIYLNQHLTVQENSGKK